MTGLARRLRFRRDHRWAPGQMSAYLDGELATRPQARMERHAGECPECRIVLEGLRRMLSRLRRLPAAQAGSPDVVAAVLCRLDEPS